MSPLLGIRSAERTREGGLRNHHDQITGHRAGSDVHGDGGFPTFYGSRYRMTNEHDDSDPMSLVNRIDATMEVVATRCEHCNLSVTVMPASGTRYVLGIDHEPSCPEYVE